MIDLWEGPNNGTYVEIRRQNGCGFECNIIRHKIINAANGQQDTTENQTLIPTIPSELMGNYHIPSSTSDLESILERTTDQFHSRDISILLFALHNLATSTNIKKTHIDTAYKMSSLIMMNSCSICDHLLEIYSAHERRRMNNDHSEQVCAACLTIFANGIMALSKSGQSLDRECKHFIEVLMPYLIDGIEKIRYTHHACRAMTCLKLLLESSSTAVTRARETNNISAVVEQAIQYGRREHCELANVARSTMNTLQSQLVV
jgi:hypothetical protein